MSEYLYDLLFVSGDLGYLPLLDECVEGHHEVGLDVFEEITVIDEVFPGEEGPDLSQKGSTWLIRVR